MCEKCWSALWSKGLMWLEMGIQKQEKNARKHIFACISLTRNSRNMVSCQCDAHTFCVTKAEIVGLKQFQLRYIVMGRFTPARRLAPCYPIDSDWPMTQSASSFFDSNHLMTQAKSIGFWVSSRFDSESYPCLLQAHPGPARFRLQSQSRPRNRIYVHDLSVTAL